MITRLTSIDELKEIFVELLLDKTDKVTKVTDDSVVGGVAFGCAKVGQRAIKDIALIETHLFPDLAWGSYLDNIASQRGVAARFTSSESSTYIRLVGDVGTQYLLGTHTFRNSSGVIFDLEEDVTIGVAGFSYAKIRSQGKGLDRNVDALTINRISPLPIGHSYCINEYQALGGRDVEDDNLFRIRIKQGANILARGTLASIEQVFMKINSNVMRVLYRGVNEQGQSRLSIVTQNGINLTVGELDELLEKGREYFTLSDLQTTEERNSNVHLSNVEWQVFDVSFRCELLPSYNPDDIRKEIQIRMSKLYDTRYWKGLKIEWDDLLQVVKSTAGVKYVPDTHFYPNTDLVVDPNRLPRLRGFLMLDLSGNILVNLTNTLTPSFYPSLTDFSFQQTVLKSL